MHLSFLVGMLFPDVLYTNVELMLKNLWEIRHIEMYVAYQEDAQHDGSKCRRCLAYA